MKKLIGSITMTITLSLTLVTMLIFFLFSEPGTHFILNMAKIFLKGQFTFEESQGKLFDTLIIKNMNYHNSFVDIKIENLLVRSHWSQFKLVNDELLAKEVSIQFKSLSLPAFSSKQKTNFSSFTLNHVLLQNVTVKYRDHVITKIDNLQTRINLSNQSNQIEVFKETNGMHFRYLDFQNINQDFSLQLKLPYQHELLILNGIGNGEGVYKFHLQLEQNSFDIAGIIQPNLRLAWNLKVANLTSLLPHSQGSIFAEGEIIGSLKKPIILGSIDIKNPSYQDYSFPTMISQFKVEPFNKKRNYASFKTTVNPGILTFRLNDEIQQLSLLSGTMTGDLTKSNLALHLDLPLLTQGHVIGEFDLPNIQTHPLVNQAITAKILWTHLDPKFIAVYIPYIKKLLGQLDLNLEVAGTIGTPSFSGSAELNQASFIIPNLNLNTNNVHIIAKGNSKNIFYHGQIPSGKGLLNIEGKTDLTTYPIATELQLVGQNIAICNTSEIKINASPQIKLKIAGKQLNLNGSIVIPEANLQPRDLGNADSLSDDIVYLQKNGKPVENNNFRIGSNILLILGDNIKLNYHGIKGQIVGQLNILDDPNKATIAYGQLLLKGGTYTVYSKTLQIDYGELNFSGGPISNPGLDIRASRTISSPNSNSLLFQNEQLRVGVSVLGSLKQPQIALFSEPAGQSQADILSYLLFGMASNATSTANVELLLQAADTLNMGGSSSILKLKNRIKQKLGLSELDIGTSSEYDPKTQETVRHTAFVLGKYFSPKFYINYSMDLFDYINTLKVRYCLNKFWTIQSTTNTNGSGVDVLYTIEK